MADVPVYQRSQGLVVPNLPAIDTGAAELAHSQARSLSALSGLALTVADYGNAVTERKQAYLREQHRRAQLTKAQMDELDLEDKVSLKVSEIASMEGSPEDRERAFDEMFSQLAGAYSYSDPDAQNAAQVAQAGLRNRYVNQLRDVMVKQEQAATEAHVLQSLDSLSKLSVGDPDQAIAKAMDIIEVQGSAAGWDAAKQYEVLRKVGSQWTANYFRRHMDASPQTAKELLLDASKTEWLDEGTRTSLLDRADRLIEAEQRERIAASERAERQAERAMKDRQEANAGAFLVGVLKGEVTEPQLIRALEDRAISASDAKTLISTLRTEAEEADDPSAALTLRQGVYDGSAGLKDIQQAFQSKLISQGTAEELMAAAQTVRTQSGPLAQEDVSMARRFVDESVGGVRGPMAILDPESSRRTASAVREFDRLVQEEFARAQSEGKPFNAQGVAEDVVSRYQLADPGVTALPLPRYAVGDRRTLDLQATRQATAEALARGEIDRATAASESRLLQQYEQALNRMRAHARAEP